MPRLAGTAASAVAPDPAAPTILTFHDIGSRFSARPGTPLLAALGDRRVSRHPRLAATAAGTVAPEPSPPAILTFHDIGTRFFRTALCAGVDRFRRQPRGLAPTP